MNNPTRFLSIAVLTIAAGCGAAEPITNSVGMRLVPLAPGEFTMGQDARQASFRSPWSAEKDRGADWDEAPAHRVRLARAFHMAANEVTNAQFEQFEPAHRARHTKSSAADDDAVVNVSWHEAVRFCAWLSQKEGRSYRLPTEAEWEYACRAGSTTLFAYGDELPAAYQALVPSQIHAYQIFFREASAVPSYYRVLESAPPFRVAQRAANTWGLFDLHGNVEEWCHDWYAPYAAGEQRDPSGPASGDFRVTRGGAVSQFARQLRSANRSSMIPTTGNETIGFRVVLAEPLLIKPPAAAISAAPTGKTPAPAPAVASAPFFHGPQEFVKIPAGSMGPLFSKHNHDPGITVCPNGDLLAIWYTCEEEPGSELAVVSSRLRRGAAEWEPATIFWDAADRNDHGPALWWDGAETLYHFNGLKQISGSIVRTSRDNGHTWTAPVVYSKATQANEANFRTRDGRILASLDGPHQSTVLEESADGGATWQAISTITKKPEFAPGKTGPAIAGIHAGVVELKDGRLLALGRFDGLENQRAFNDTTPRSISADGGRTWTYSVSPFLPISSGQRFTLKRLREGPLLLCSFTEMRVKKDDFGRVIGGKPLNERVGLKLPATGGGEVTVHGLFAALSFDEGETWPVRRLVTPGGAARLHTGIDGGTFNLGETEAEPSGYLAMCQDPAGAIHLISSRNYYRFNLPWIQQRTTVPR
ncbi:MAG: hypothetical protein RL077_5863 [Verrucomicrobiota bacterium]|jgi:formylglycine-generating enzyme required for sulfatase activity